MSIRALPITAYSMCNCLGRTTESVVDSLAESRSGLGAPPFQLPFETVCGIVPGELPSPDPQHSAYDTRLVRIVLETLQGIRPSLMRRFRDGAPREWVW